MDEQTFSVGPNGERYYVHAFPLERDRTDFIIQCRMDHEEPPKYEQLWTRKLDEGTFEVCCIPQYIYGIALRDHIALSDDFASVLKHGGHYTFRVWFGAVEGEFAQDIPHASHEYVHVVLNQLQQLDAQTEFGSRHLLGVDASSREIAERVFDFLGREERSFKLHFENGMYPP
jgi:hypothetical protein